MQQNRADTKIGNKNTNEKIRWNNRLMIAGFGSAGMCIIFVILLQQPQFPLSAPNSNLAGQSALDQVTPPALTPTSTRTLLIPTSAASTHVSATPLLVISSVVPEGKVARATLLTIAPTLSAGISTSIIQEKISVSTWQITLDVFSGRPNPAWNLTQEEMSNFNIKIARHSKKPGGKIPDNLGYRGFVISSSNNRTLTFKIYNTTIQHEENGKILYYNDPNREIEKWLLTITQQHIDSVLYESLKAQIFS